MYIYICIYIYVYIYIHIYIYISTVPRIVVLSPISSLNQSSDSLGLFCHVPLTRDQSD